MASTSSIPISTWDTGDMIQVVCDVALYDKNVRNVMHGTNGCPIVLCQLALMAHRSMCQSARMVNKRLVPSLPLHIQMVDENIACRKNRLPRFACNTWSNLRQPQAGQTGLPQNK